MCRRVLRRNVGSKLSNFLEQNSEDVYEPMRTSLNGSHSNPLSIFCGKLEILPFADFDFCRLVCSCQLYSLLVVVSIFDVTSPIHLLIHRPAELFWFDLDHLKCHAKCSQICCMTKYLEFVSM